MKSTLVLSLLALSTSVLATPPACLIAAVNTEPNPSDLKVVCGADAKKVQAAIASLCSTYASAAQSAFIATCSSAGETVAPYTASSTKSSASHASTSAPASYSGTFVYTTAVYNSDCSCTTTIVTSATNPASTFTGFSSATATASVASATGSASSSSATGAAAGGAQKMGSFAAAAVAIAGVVAVL